MTSVSSVAAVFFTDELQFCKYETPSQQVKLPAKLRNPESRAAVKSA